MKTQRIQWIDQLKGIGIVLMLLGHVCNATFGVFPGIVNFIIYSFHMPLFFFLSGYTFSIEKYCNYGEFLWRKIKTILIPMVTFSVFTILVECIIKGMISANTDYSMIQAINSLLGIVVQAPAGPYKAMFWFFSTLFIAENILYLLIRYIKKEFVVRMDMQQ